MGSMLLESDSQNGRKITIHRAIELVGSKDANLFKQLFSLFKMHVERNTVIPDSPL